MDQENLAVLCRTKDVLATWQDFDADDVVKWIWVRYIAFGTRVWFLVRRAYKATTKTAGVLEVEESDVAICKGASHVRFELMHGDR